MTFDDPDVDGALDRLRDAGRNHAEAMLAEVMALGERGTEDDFERLLHARLKIIRERIEHVMAGETDPNAPHAAELMASTMEEGLFEALRVFAAAIDLAGAEPAGTA